ncbi:TrmB family transcriptional regulator [Halogeometricum luteum]|uniref:Helix-turn-helix domain-containing protein n=1 Tax=Halogeometricum luteum TaxID=2950537 RepID=A0ABU2G308_9EURY|nr:helix-turn-helix domain-containing protein [Halogeometricum sp. S3BR5-2]MDS0295158.1 helix-turn-helix domain-containing protein [Halogeometricum sp. S3BR5-2]
MPTQSETAELLEWFGLSSYEASVFVALQRLGRGTAKEIASLSGVPRSQIYGAADSLQEQGLVEVQQSNPRIYRPIAVDEAIDQLKQRYERRTADAEQQLKQIRNERRSREQEQKEDVWTVSGAAAVKSRIAKIVSDTEERLVVGIDENSPLFEQLVTQLAEKSEQGVEIVVVTESETAAERLEPFASVVKHREAAGADVPRPQHVLIADDETILLGVQANEEETAIWSSGTNFAKVLIQLARSGMDRDS